MRIMPKQNTGPLVIYNVFNVAIIVIEAWLCGYMWEGLDLVKKPLTVTPLCTATLALTGAIGLHCLQGAPSIKKWQLLKGGCLVLLAVVLFHFVTVLYGAPLTESVAETFHFSSLLAALTVLPSCVVLGIDSKTWVRIYAHNRPESVIEACIQLTTLCTLVGAWVGAFPIPLDWDRPWQTWPVTCVNGALAGNMVGHMWSAYTAQSRIANIQKTKLG